MTSACLGSLFRFLVVVVVGVAVVVAAEDCSPLKVAELNMSSWYALASEDPSTWDAP